MATEQFIVTALPYSCGADADFHVSLFVAPALVPDGGEEPLQDFEHFAHWAAAIKDGAEIQLLDDNGPLECAGLLDAVDPDVWDAAFPPDTPVRGRDLPQLADRPWRTFSAGYLHDTGKYLHLLAMFADPTSPPAPSAHPLVGPIGGLLRELEVPFVFDRRQVRYDESLVTERLDSQIGEGGERIALPELERMLAATEDPMRRFALELHRARRFYERPEAALPYAERPADGAVHERPPRPGPDFHERCTLAGDHPGLLRTLGLVVDLRVADPDRLRSSAWLSARILPGGDERPCQVTRTRCEAAGDDLVTVPETADWSQGRLRVGDPTLFQLLDMDADGTALKLDRFVWTLPRLLTVQANGDPVHAAPTALRSVGFTVARNQRAQAALGRQDRQTALQNGINGGEPVLLTTEDVNRGMRVEVWDDTAKAWHTLHARRIDVDVDGHGEVEHDLPEVGFIQGTAATETPDVPDSPVHVHEAAFGWSGWSLSAPRPGRRVRHDPESADPGHEVVEEPDAVPDAVTPVVVKARVEPGTLPVLRYGRSYAFRAWAVDLAGNSRPHSVGGVGGGGGEGGPADPQLASVVSSVLAQGAPVSAVSAAAAQLAVPVRASAVASVFEEQAAAAAEATQAEVAPLSSTVELFTDVSLARTVVGRIRERRDGQLLAGPATPATDDPATRARIVSRAFTSALTDPATPVLVEPVVREAPRLADMLAAAGLVVAEGPLVVRELETITPLRPFLRWDPVPPPAVVPRHRFSAGESLRVVVVRSGVTQDLDTLAITVTPPGAYAAAHADLHFRDFSERHLAPPKTSQVEAELHGRFDEAIGSQDPGVHRKLAAVALREAGTFFDVAVPRLDDPSTTDPQPGISLERDAEVSAVDPKALPLAPGEAPAPGQYVVHDTDGLVLPYLPDAVARGISLVFQEAGRDRQLAFPFGAEGFTARYLGDWPAARPFRLVLEGAAALTGRLDDTVLRIGLPPGDVQRFRLSSSLDRADLDLFGLWRSLPDVVRNDTDVAEAAADGWLWAFTPFEDVTLVHAVPRPVEAPRPTVLASGTRLPGSVEVPLTGAVDVHGPSTDSLTLEAAWTDSVDDVTLPAPEDRPQRGVAFTTAIAATEDLALLGSADTTIPLPGVGPVQVHRAVHRLGDTRHRDVRYRFRATTRFREYFDAAALTPADPGGPTPADPDRPADDGRSVVGPLVTVDIPSSARPAAPIVHSVVPLFRWDEGTEPEQPVAVRRRRRAGVRIYLERPWFSSGNGELLGVLLAPGGMDTDDMTWVSQWGSDPVWVSAPVKRRALFLQVGDILHAAGLDDRPGDAIPVVPPRTLPLAALPGSPDVLVLGYQPQFNVARGLWYVDVAINPVDAFWPFVRLAVARYQPSSVDGCHLSAPVRCDYAQLTPERTCSVSRTDIRHVRVVVSGPVGSRTTPERVIVGDRVVAETVPGFAQRVSANRTVVARLQQRDPLVDTDLGWRTVATTQLTIRGHGRSEFEAAWVGSLEAPEDLPLHRPGGNADWRVTVEEWERLPGDPASLAPSMIRFVLPVWEQRLVYADEITL